MNIAWSRDVDDILGTHSLAIRQDINRHDVTEGFGRGHTRSALTGPGAGARWGGGARMLDGERRPPPL